MSIFGAVLDTAVLFPGSLRSILLRCAENELFKPYWSPDILDELARNLLKKGVMSKAQIDHLIAAMSSDDGFEDALVERAHYAWRIPHMLNDPKDRHVLAVADAVKADLIVTFNLKDFPAKALTPISAKLEVKHPDKFLTDQFFLKDPDLVVRLIARESQVLRNPPQTVQQVLDTLRVHVPSFVGEVENYLAQTERKYRRLIRTP